MGFFDKLKKITSNLFSGFTEADEDFFEELEETLIMADLGVDAATDAVEKLRTKVRKEHLQGQEEVREALRTGSGSSTRYSSTLLEKTSYYAQRMPDGSVLRISVSRATVGMLVLGMLPAILLAAAAALVLSGLLAGRLSRRITAPLNALDLEHPLENDTYEELSPLLCRINVQRQQIDRQLTDLRRRSIC